MNEIEVNSFEDLLKMFFEREISEYEWDGISFGLVGRNRDYKVKIIDKIREVFLQKENTNFFKITDIKEIENNIEESNLLIHLCVLQDSADRMFSIAHQTKQIRNLFILRYRLEKIKEKGILYFLFDSRYIKALDPRIRDSLSILIRTDLGYRNSEKSFKFISVRLMTGNYLLFRRDNLTKIPDEAIESFLKQLIERAMRLQHKTIGLLEFDPDTPFELGKIKEFLKEKEIQYFIDNLNLNRSYKKLYE